MFRLGRHVGGDFVRPGGYKLIDAQKAFAGAGGENVPNTGRGVV